MDYMPSSDGDRIPWFVNIDNKINDLQVVLGLSDDNVSEVHTICKSAIEKIQNVPISLATYQAAVTAKDVMETAGEIKAIRTIIAKWKVADGYTTTIGNTLVIVGEGPSLDATNYKAILSGSIEADAVRLKFKKNGVDSVNIYKRKKGSLDWTFLVRDTSSPYDDHIVLAIPGQPEHWEYISFGVKKDLQVGAPSDIIQIVYGGIV